jgi:hypothetical protein
MDRGPNPLCYLGELGPGMPVNKNIPNLGPRLSVLSHDGQLLARLGDIRPGEAPGQFIAPHGLALDSRGDIYVGEVSWTIAGQHLKPPREMRSLQKLIKRN